MGQAVGFGVFIRIMSVCCGTGHFPYPITYKPCNMDGVEGWGCY